MSTVALEEAGTRQLQEILEELPKEQTIVITKGGQPVATLQTAPDMSKRSGHSILDFKSRSVGGFLKPLPHPDDDILGEMLDNKFDSDK